MSPAVPFRLACACGFLCFSATALPAQDTQPAAATAAPELPIIADEPEAIDPAAFVPARLAAAATVDLADSSLRELVGWLIDDQRLVVLLDNDALSEIGVLLGDPISDRLEKTPIYLLLNRLRSLGLAWYFEDEVVHITSTEAVAARLTTTPYTIGDLLDAGYELDALAEVVENAVAPESWDTIGGPGAVSFLGDVMFVRQTDDLQREVSGLLAGLRKHGRRTFTLDPPEHTLLRRKLEENVTAAFRDAPLESAVRQLAHQTQIDIRLDMPALRAIGVREREPVTLSLSDRKLKTVLQAMLIGRDLTWILRDGVLWITSHDEADAFCKTAVYDVRDLCRDDAECEALMEAIVSHTRPVWADFGGAATIQFARPGTLVIHGTESTLAEVLDLLETYRTALRSSKPRKRAGEDPNQVITVYYRMHADVAEGLAMLLPTLVRPTSWKSVSQPEAPGEVFLTSSPPDLSDLDAATEAGQSASALVIARAVLIIRQTRAAHDEIEEVIRRVQYGDAQMLDHEGALPSAGFGGAFFSIPAGSASEQEE